MHRIVRVGMTLVLGTMAGLSVGWGNPNGGVSSSADPQDIFHQNMLSELGEILTVRKNDSKPPPARLEDLTTYQNGWPVGYTSVKDGSVVLVWGASIQDGAADKILAHEKGAAESGGFVLMQDGKTVKKLTADEFKAAPMAGKN